MFFKNLRLFMLADAQAMTAESFNEALAKQAFAPLGPQQMITQGWTAPAKHQSDQFAVVSNGAVLVALKSEEKLIPPRVIRRESENRIAEIEEREKRKVGRKEAKEIRERMADELLPRAFTDDHITRAIVDLVGGWVWVDSASASAAEQLVGELRKAMENFTCRLGATELSPVLAMTTWLQDSPPDGLTVDNEAKLALPEEDGAEVSCKRHDLSSDEVRQHLSAGKTVRSMAMTFNDRVSFVLTEDMCIRRLGFLDLVQEQIKESMPEDAAAMFDSELFIMVSEIRALIDGVITALGGLAKKDGGNHGV